MPADVTCSTCPFGKQTAGREGREYKCRRDPPTGSGWPSVDAADSCGEHPLHPMQRDRLAAMAMQAFCADPTINAEPWQIAQSAYTMANAMLAERALRGVGHA